MGSKKINIICFADNAMLIVDSGATCNLQHIFNITSKVYNERLRDKQTNISIIERLEISYIVKLMKRTLDRLTTNRLAKISRG